MTDAPQPEKPSLMYQKQRSLEQVPGYQAGAQLQLSTGARVYVALSATELVLYFEDNHAFHYDLEGRLVKIAQLNQFYRRSLSHRVLFSRKRTAEEGGGVERVVLTEADADAMVADAHVVTETVFQEWHSGAATLESAKPSPEQAAELIGPLLHQAASFDLAAAHADTARFKSIYGRVAVLPPDQYNALVLQVTAGCQYHGCAFCELYRDVSFSRKTPEQFQQHLDQALAYHGRSIRARRSIFLGEANALTSPQADLRDIFKILNQRFYFPVHGEKAKATEGSSWLGSDVAFDGVSSFLDVFTRPRTAAEYRDLRELGLRRVYVGMETGCDELQRWLKKPASAEAVAECVRTLKEAKLVVGVIVLIGAGGQAFYLSHVRETVQLLNRLPLGIGDYVYLSPLVVYPGCPYEVQAMEAAVTGLSPALMRQQEHEIRSGLRFDTRRGRPYMARYELETFVY